MIRACCFDTTVLMIPAIWLAMDGRIFMAMSGVSITRSCAIFAQGIKRFLHMNMNCSQPKSSESMKNLVMTILGRSIKVVSRVIQNVASAGNDSTVMMNSTLIVVINMKSATFATGGPTEESSGIMLTIILWKDTFDKIISYVWIKNV